MLNTQDKIIKAPSDPALWPQYREELTRWRQQTRQALNYDDTLYGKPEFRWSSSNYVCGFVMMYDSQFYDATTGRYTVDAVLEAGLQEFGGYDSVVLWHAYPRIGFDARNQFDFYRDMPGGLGGVRAVVDAFHERGVKVYINYNPWDVGTRREGRPDTEMLAEMTRTLDVDGLFLDTMTQGGAEFRAMLDATRPGVIMEGEGSPPQPQIADHHASWGQWCDDSEAPGVLRHKWYERRHMQHQTQRWNSDHSAELHTAWMNGSGMMVWENVFGAWVPWNARDRSLLRAMLPVQRRYTRLFSSEGWTPLVPVLQSQVYASLWQDDTQRLWTLVNRANQPVHAAVLQVQALPGERYFDLIRGHELHPRVEDGQAELALNLPACGLGGVLALPADRVDADLLAFLSTQAATQALASSDTTRPYLPMQPRAVAPTARLAAPPAGMAETRHEPWTRSLAVQFRARECGFYDSNVSDDTGFRDSYDFRVSEFTRPLPSHRFAIDETPVTNAQYLAFLQASGYRPEVPDRFLAHWTDGKPPTDHLDHPVVWVDLTDARAYAAWAGKRLPTEEEWQYAAQGGDGREYPWGNGIRVGVCNLGETGDTTPVKAFPAGRTPTGVYDLCGNVWQWTDSESTEGRTRFCMLRGGAWFNASGSQWYADGGVRPASYSAKFLLMWPGLDRCATVGFRCVVDLTES